MMRERHIDWMSPVHALTRARPTTEVNALDQESSLPPLGPQADARITEVTSQGYLYFLKINP